MTYELTGRLTESLAGHDRGALYVILSEDERFAYAADGRLKTAESPKRKNRKHLRILQDTPFLDRLQAGAALSNEEIKHYLKQIRTERSVNNKGGNDVESR